jgi:cyclase
VKTVRFASPTYVGDPLNTVGIFSEMEVDELVIIDIGVAKDRRPIDWALLEGIATACFMPFGYGGGIQTLDDIGRLHALGAEKVVINRAAFRDVHLVESAASRFGSQSVVVSVDVKGTGAAARVFTDGKPTVTDPVVYARTIEAAGAGELLLTSVDREGTFGGYDLELVKRVCGAVSIPVVVNGGAGTLDDAQSVVQAGASGAAAGSMVVFQGRNRAVLVNYPSRSELRATFAHR